MAGKVVPINITPLVTCRVVLLLRTKTKSAKIEEKKFVRVGDQLNRKFSLKLVKNFNIHVSLLFFL